MATESGGTPTPVTSAEAHELQPEGLPVNTNASRQRTVEQQLWEEGFAFDFFQAVRLLERLAPQRQPVGRVAPPRAEAVRFRAHLSLTFPPSAIYELDRPSETLPLPSMVVTFLGLIGPSGVLPRHYTELLLRLDRETKGPERYALRAWLDLFNHRWISLFYRAGEKYRFYLPYERGEYARKEPDPFTRSLFSLVGLGLPPLRNRLRVSAWEESTGQERVLARIDDLALLYYGGLLSHRPRCAVALETLLQDYFQLPIRVRQFQGQWLVLDPANQSRMGGADGNNQLGVTLVAGERVWDVQSKIRIRVGGLRYDRFLEFLPDRAPVFERKAFFLLCHLVRLYVGPELDFDVQLILKAEDVPPCQLQDGAGIGPHLGWNTWLGTGKPLRDADDAVFEGEEIVFVNGRDVFNN
jgi:type VI secretion system protein ImpH